MKCKICPKTIFPCIKKNHNNKSTPWSYTIDFKIQQQQICSSVNFYENCQQKNSLLEWFYIYDESIYTYDERNWDDCSLGYIGL